MRQATEKHRGGIQWTLTTRLEDLDFADDIVLLSHNHHGMQLKLMRLAKISAKTGIRISKSKAKVMRVNTRNANKLELDGEAIDEVENFTYLGSNISKDGGSDRDIQTRIGKARTTFAMLTPVWRWNRWKFFRESSMVTTTYRTFSFVFLSENKRSSCFNCK